MSIYCVTCGLASEGAAKAYARMLSICDVLDKVKGYHYAAVRQDAASASVRLEAPMRACYRKRLAATGIQAGALVALAVTVPMGEVALDHDADLFGRAVLTFVDEVLPSKTRQARWPDARDAYARATEAIHGAGDAQPVLKSVEPVCVTPRLSLLA